LKRLSIDEALNLIEHADLNELGRAAFARKRELHPDRVTTLIIDRNINYTNACMVDCKFCAFYRHASDADAYVLSFEQIGEKIASIKKFPLNMMPAQRATSSVSVMPRSLM